MIWQAIDLFFKVNMKTLPDIELTDLDWELLMSIWIVLQVSFHPDPYVAPSIHFSGSS